MESVHPYLNFNGDAEEAFAHYSTVFGTEVSGLLRFRDMGDDEMGVPESDLDKVAHVSLPLSGSTNLMASDVVGADAERYVAGRSTYIYLETDSAEEAERVFAGLSSGGEVEMPLTPTAWAEKYGVCADRFGIRWMVSYTGDVEFELPNE